MTTSGAGLEQTDRTETTHRVEWHGEHATFNCDGDRYSKCHIYPDCECELWYFEDQPDGTRRHPHPEVVHDECWMLPWLNNVDATDTWEGGEDPAHVDGPVELTWDGDNVLWDYYVPLVRSR